MASTSKTASPVVYICHAFASDPSANAERVRKICHWFSQQGYLPLAPHIYLPQFLDESTERHIAMDLCRRLIELADQLLVFGDPTPGMQLEILEAHSIGIPVVHVVPCPKCKHPEGRALGALLEEIT